MPGKRSLDGLMSHLLDQIALCGEHGEFDVYVSGYSTEGLASKRNVHIWMVFGCLFPARAGCRCLCYCACLFESEHKVMFSQRYALTSIFLKT